MFRVLFSVFSLQPFSFSVFRLADCRARALLLGVKRLGLVFSFFALLLAGCSSYLGMAEPSSDPAKYHEYFVKENLDDNHGIAARIATELKEHGYKVNSGPMTMLPPTADALIDYQDQWSWDFTTHLVDLVIHVSDVHNNSPLAMARFGGVTSTASLDDAIEGAVNKLVKAIEAQKAARAKAFANAPAAKH